MGARPDCHKADREPILTLFVVIGLGYLLDFIYTIGLQNGPEFFKSLREQGYRDSLFALVMVGLGAGVALLVSYPAHLTRPRVAGLYTGAMTNTPPLPVGHDRKNHSGAAADIESTRFGDART
jgi:putative transport protein